MQISLRLTDNSYQLLFHSIRLSKIKASESLVVIGGDKGIRVRKLETVMRKKPTANRKYSSSTAFALVMAISVIPAISYAQIYNGIEEIIVTATKTSEKSARDIGISLQAISETALEEKGADDFSSYAEGLVSVSFADRGPGQQLIAIRGVNSSTTIVNTDEPEAQAAVGVYIDETPVSLAGYNPDLKLFDVNRIEVLRGPQGTLYGAGSLSGTIRIITNSADTSAFQGKTSLTRSSTRGGGINYSVNGLVNVPLIEDKLALRVVGTASHEGGFIDNVAAPGDPRHPLFNLGINDNSHIEDVNTEDTYNIRAQLRFLPTENLELAFKYIRQETDLDGSQTEDTYTPGEVLPGNNEANAGLADYEQSRVTPEPWFDEFNLYSIEATWDLGFANLTSVTSYFDRYQTNRIESADFLPFLLGGAPFDTTTAILINSTDVEDVVQEFRLTGSAFDGRVEYVGGIFYNKQDKIFIQDFPTSGLTEASQVVGAADICEVFAAPDCETLSSIVGYPINPENLFESTSTFKTEQIAIFGELGIDLSDQWRLILGGRYFDYDQNFVFDEIGGIFAAGTTIDNDLNEQGFSPKVALEYKLDDVLLYGSASQGFRLGGNNDPVSVELCGANIPKFESDSLWTFEVGAKSQFNERIQLNAAAYYTDWSDVPISDPLDGTCGFKQTVNSGNVEIIGLETELKMLITENFIWDISASYTNARFIDDIPGAVLPVIVSSDDKLPMVPEYVFSTNATYLFPVGEGGKLHGFFNINASYRSEQFNQAESSGGVELDAYGSINSKIGVETDDWTIALFVTNLTDERNVLFKDTIYLLENRDAIAKPRAIGVNLRMSF